MAWHPVRRVQVTIRSVSTSWCPHPDCDLLRPYGLGLKAMETKRICGLCGELLYVLEV